MGIDATSSAASRLCAACGMCCDGTLFHVVQMQPLDSIKKLLATGLKLKHKRRVDYIQQPCPAYKASGCTIYEVRPERCRKFECVQLKGVLAGRIAEETAMTKIHEARLAVVAMERLFQEAGESNPKRPLTQRYARIIEQPVDAAHDPAGAAVREKMTGAMRELEVFLEVHFHPGVPVPKETQPPQTPEQGVEAENSNGDA